MFSFGMSSSIDTDKAHLRSLCGLSTKLKTTALGTYYYDFEELPQEISIYPVDFKLKDKIKTYLDKWNSEDTITLSNGVNLKAEDRDELTYEDTISLIVMVIFYLFIK